MNNRNSLTGGRCGYHWLGYGLLYRRCGNYWFSRFNFLLHNGGNRLDDNLLRLLNLCYRLFPHLHHFAGLYFLPHHLGLTGGRDYRT